MKYPLPLLQGTLIKRYKRFLSDVTLPDGSMTTAHCPNSGTMKTCAEAGRLVLLSDHGLETKRKLRYTWEAIRMGRTWVVVNTMNPNRVVKEAILKKSIPELNGYQDLRTEVKYGEEMRSRIDLLLENPDKNEKCFVEVKNATMRVEDGVRFPDAVTTRGLKHLKELAREAKRGHRAVIFFFVGRSDANWMGPADAIDPEYGKMLRHVVNDCGVEALAYQAHATPKKITIIKRLPIHLD